MELSKKTKPLLLMMIMLILRMKLMMIMHAFDIDNDGDVCVDNCKKIPIFSKMTIDNLSQYFANNMPKMFRKCSRECLRE